LCYCFLDWTGIYSPGYRREKMAKPESKKIFFENLSGAGKAIAVLTSGGDAQGKLLRDSVKRCGAVTRYGPAEGELTSRGGKGVA